MARLLTLAAILVLSPACGAPQASTPPSDPVAVNAPPRASTASAPNGTPGDARTAQKPVPEVLVARDGVTFDGTKLFAFEGDGSSGAGAQEKRNGMHDLYLVRLHDALVRAQAEHRLPVAQDGVDARTAPIRIQVAPDVAYRAIFEVLYTVSQTQLDRIELAETSTRRSVVTEPPRVTDAARDARPAWSLFITPDGVIVRSPRSVEDCGAGTRVGVPRARGKQDVAGVVACLDRLKAASPEKDREIAIIVGGTGATPFGEILDVIVAARDTSKTARPTAVHFAMPKG